MKLEIGRYYKTRDGRKVGPVKRHGSGWATEDTVGAFEWYEDGFCFASHKHHDNDLIAPWTEEVGTLEEIGAQVGDVVEWSSSRTAAEYKVDSVEYGDYTFTDTDGRYPFSWNKRDQEEDRYSKWRIISRAQPEPTGPVRTVTTTRQEIVPGVYGRLGIKTPPRSDIHDWVVSVSMVNLSGNHNVFHHWTADELTAAITTLTSIRDAM